MPCLCLIVGDGPASPAAACAVNCHLAGSRVRGSSVAREDVMHVVTATAPIPTDRGPSVGRRLVRSVTVANAMPAVRCHCSESHCDCTLRPLTCGPQWRFIEVGCSASGACRQHTGADTTSSARWPSETGRRVICLRHSDKAHLPLHGAMWEVGVI